MQITLEKLGLTNYRNIPHAEYLFNGSSKIVGENRIGKTNTLEAIAWLLSDKLLNGSSDIASIKPLKDTKAAVRVEATFSLFDESNPQIPPRTISLAKEYGEDWVKTRGTADLTMKGHYLNYFYNGVKQKTQRDFYALFKEDFKIKGDYRGIDLTRLLIDPFYVGDLGESANWKDLRAFIISLIGDISDDDVFAKNPVLYPLKKDLDARFGRIDELKKFYNGEIDSLEEQLVGDDAQIEFLENTPCPSDEEVAIATQAIKELDEDIAKLQLDKSSDSAIVDIDKQINEKRAAINQINIDALNNRPGLSIKKEIDDLNQLYNEKLQEKLKITTDIEKANSRKESLEREVKWCGERRTGYITQLREIDAELNQPFKAECPTCHRPFEGEELEAAKEKFVNNLTSRKATILSEGKANKERKDSLQEEIDGIEIGIEISKGQLKTLEGELDELNEKIKDSNKRFEEAQKELIVLPPEHDELEKQVKDLVSQKAILIADRNALNAVVRDKIEEKVEKKATYQKVLDDAAYASRQKDNLESVKLKKKEHTSKLLQLEQNRELINLFIKTKLDMLDGHVARVFGNIKFQLIKENINGGYDPICKPYIYDIDKDQSTNVSWRNGSKSERVVTGIAIAEAIKNELGLADLPFLFDEGGEISTETFNTKFKTKAQLICVKVMDNIKTPTVMRI